MDDNTRTQRPNDAMSTAKEKAFFDLARRFRDADNDDELKQLGEDLGRFIFGE